MIYAKKPLFENDIYHNADIILSARLFRTLKLLNQTKSNNPLSTDTRHKLRRFDFT